jgi:hypothetical protein
MPLRQWQGPQERLPVVAAAAAVVAAVAVVAAEATAVVVASAAAVAVPELADRAVRAPPQAAGAANS